MMTKLELTIQNQRRYAILEASIPSMAGLEKSVAQHITLTWIKGRNWMGGLPDSVANKVYPRVIKEMSKAGYLYTWDDVEEEAHRQQRIW